MKAKSAFALSLFACFLFSLVSMQPAHTAGSAKEKSMSISSKRAKGERAGKGERAKARQQKEKQRKQKQAQIAKARKQRAKEAAARRSRVAGASGGAGEMGGEMAEDLDDVNEGPGGAKIIHHSHVLYLKDGSKMKGSILMRGAKSIIILTEEGELELHPDDLEQIATAEEQAPPVYASTQIFEGHEYLTAPEVEEEEYEEELEEEVVEEAVEEPEEEVEVKLPVAPLLEPVAPVKEETVAPVTEPVIDVIQPTVAPKAVKPKLLGRPVMQSTGNQDKQKMGGGATVGGRTAAMDSQRPRPGTRKPAAITMPAEPKKQGMSDLLKSLETTDGLNSILEQLKSNPDFFKSFDLDK
jgi:hypothetical protein